jgi:manganese transport protein
VCRARFRRPVTVGLWAQAEAVAMATDLAEFVGAALALHILFDLPLLVGGVVTAVAAFGILGLQAAGFRHLEAGIAAFVGVIVVAFGAQVLLAQPSMRGIAEGLAVPRIPDSGALLISVGILGATVMPHVIYLHSALTSGRIVGATPWARRRIFRFEALDVVLALGLAGLVNMSMLILAASTLHVRGLESVGDDLTQVADQLGAILGVHADVLFGVALLASGLSSSSVGTLAGQVVMEGFLRRRIPLWLRRGVTMAPALAILAIGVDPSRALVISQVVLSFGIPFALIPLVAFTADRGLMGILVNRRVTTAAAALVATAIVALNIVLLTLTLTG